MRRTTADIALTGARAQAVWGIDAAQSLGTEALLPDLQALLFSMHGAVRTMAKETLDQIHKLVFMRSKQAEPAKK